jgi:hypothetical protein
VADEAPLSRPTETVAAGMMPDWQVAELPQPPPVNWNPRLFIGPGLMMAGAAIGGGEWLMGPAVTARYGGIVMWLALASILFQLVYNLEIMRYTAYCGEPIFVGFFRVRPGPRFWTCVYLFVDFFGLVPYLASNAAVPLHAAFLGHLPGVLPTHYLPAERVATEFAIPLELAVKMRDHPEGFTTDPQKEPKTKESEKLPVPASVAARMAEEEATRQRIGYAVFLVSFLPLIFGGKVYTSLERLMVVKLFLVLGYLLFIGFFYVSAGTWGEVFAGFLFLGKGSDGAWGFRLFPDVAWGELDWALLGAFAAIAGQGGMTNSQLSTYVRDKGWGMGAQVGAVPSLIGGKGIVLSHTGKVFLLSDETRRRWRGWMRFFLRDQVAIWTVGCILGVAIPALVSLQFVRGKVLQGDAVAAETANAIVQTTGIPLFWLLTLLCGFVILLPSQISQEDGITRRWTDILWTGNRRLRRLEGHKVAYVYYGLLLAYAVWGFVVLVMVGSPSLLIKIAGVLMNFALGFSSFHVLAVNRSLLPRELRPRWWLQLGLVGCGVFFVAVSSLGALKLLREYDWIG